MVNNRKLYKGVNFTPYKMSLDLKIIPLKDKKALEDSTVLERNSLSFGPDYSIFEQIGDVDGKPMRKDFDEGRIIVIPHLIPEKLKVQVYDEEVGLKEIHKDGYEKELTYAFASEMKKIKLPDATFDVNRAIMAYIKALPDETPIILHWE